MERFSRRGWQGLEGPCRRPRGRARSQRANRVAGRSRILAVVLVGWLVVTGCGRGLSEREEATAPSHAVVRLGGQALCSRLMAGEPTVVEDLRGTLPPRSESFVRDPLVCAIAGNRLAAVEVLLDGGYDANWSGPGEAPIADAFRSDFVPSASGADQQYLRDRRRMLRLMLDSGMDPCQPYRRGVAAGLTAYQLAVQRGEAATVELFEEAGAACANASTQLGP